ncbi:hypothetical protein DFH11DRAFT_1539902 [Phellopilus nigrolimitatus]|nr:hypothetical protein DFH11DRAFT_1539902 [Phellopilus nigrolimitatus]
MSTPDPVQHVHNVFWEREPAESRTSLSTNATAPNLPGAGRTVGIVYDRLGRVVVTHLNRLAGRLRAIRTNNRPAFQVAPATVLPNNSEEAASISSISTTATAPNLPGAGRTLGLAYDLVGGIIESRLNSLASKFGYGPIEASRRIFERADRIRTERYKDGLHDYRLVEFVRSSDEAKFRRDCRRLLKYSRSQVVSSQDVALEEILDFSVREPYIRELFNRLDAASSLGAVASRLELSSYDPDIDPLLASSRKALISVTEVSVNGLSESLATFFHSNENRYEFANNSLRHMLAYLNDEVVSFLVLRQLEVLLDDSLFAHYDLSEGSFAITVVSDALTKLVSGPSDHVDWESLDMVLDMWISVWDNRLEIQKETADILRIVYRFPEHLPNTVSRVNASVELFGTRNDLSPPLALWAVIEEEVAGENLNAVPFEEHLLSRMWENLFCPANVLMRQIFLERRPLWSDTSGRPKRVDIERVTQTARFFFSFEQLVELLKSTSHSNDEGIRSRAAVHIRTSRRFDRYCWNAIAHFDHAGFYEVDSATQLTTIDASSVLNFGYPGLRLYQGVCHDNDLHLIASDWQDFQCQCSDAIDWRLLQLGPHEALWLEVAPASTFVASGHHPVLARLLNSKGQREYVAGVFLSGRAYWSAVRFCTVTDGASSVTYRDSGGNKKTSNHFHVLVLRFEPNLYPAAKMEHNDGVITSLPWKEI